MAGFFFSSFGFFLFFLSFFWLLLPLPMACHPFREVERSNSVVRRYFRANQVRQPRPFFISNSSKRAAGPRCNQGGARTAGWPRQRGACVLRSITQCGGFRPRSFRRSISSSAVRRFRGLRSAKHRHRCVQPRRGDRLKPGAEAPGRGANKTPRSPEGEADWGRD